jgi:sugar lactone lactonase YvrE
MQRIARPAVRAVVAITTSLVAALSASPALAHSHHHRAFIDQFGTISTLSSAVPAGGPAAGDVNPYGVAVVDHSRGDLVKGDVLISNFNNGQNQQGTGSSIVEISPSGQQHVFAVVPAPTSTPAVGLTTALAVLKDGFVVVGSLPAPGGDSSMAAAGALTILDSSGAVVSTITAPDINGPWDMTAVEHDGRAVLFVTNVLNGTVAGGGHVVNQGTVVRITLRMHGHRAPVVSSNDVIADGFAEHTDPNALVVGPTGVGLGDDGVLYVADSNGNRIAAVPNALERHHTLHGGGTTVSMGGALNDPLGLTVAPNGDIVTANGGDGNLVETTPSGNQVANKQLVADGGGDLFGIAVAPHGDGLYFVNDSGDGPAANSLQLLH